MNNPEVFYNKEDLWNIANERYAGSTVRVEPYYIIIKLPDEEREEFVLMLPFTPVNRNNMIAWMAARSDGDNYGELLLYRFSKDRLIYGPMQVESRIDQEPEISQLLSLWSQRGSQVIRGNMLVIPIEESILYVEPVFLQAENSQLPELKRIVVAYENRIVMKQNLDEALEAIFGMAPAVDIDEELEEEFIEEVGELEIDDETETIDDLDDREIPETVTELSLKAMELYESANESAQSGDWASYGNYLEELKNILEKLNEIAQ